MGWGGGGGGCQGRKKKKREGGRKSLQGTVNLSCKLVPKDAAAASLSTCSACQIHRSNVCYNNIFQRTAVQNCCSLPRQDSKSLQQYDSQLRSSPNKHPPPLHPPNIPSRKIKDVPKVFGFYLLLYFYDAIYGG